MRYRTLGSSDLQVSEISLGSWLTYSGGVEADADPRLHRRRVRRPGSTSSTPPTSTAAAPPRRRGARSSPVVRATPTSWRRRSGARCRTIPPTAACRPRRSPSRSTPRSRGCKPTTSTSTRRTASTPTSPIEETIEALQQVVADGKARYLGFSEWTPSRSRRRSRSAAPTCSSPPSRSIRCSGRRRRRRSSRSARPTGSPRSCGRRSRKGC